MPPKREKLDKAAKKGDSAEDDGQAASVDGSARAPSEMPPPSTTPKKRKGPAPKSGGAPSLPATVKQKRTRASASAVVEPGAEGGTDFLRAALLDQSADAGSVAAASTCGSDAELAQHVVACKCAACKAKPSDIVEWAAYEVVKTRGKQSGQVKRKPIEELRLP